jgi:PAS domain S-box-containing protein
VTNASSPSTTRTLAGALARPTLWTWGAIALSVIVSSSISYIHFRQQEILGEAVVVMAELRQARIDLSKGLVQVTLAGDPAQPFSREQGLGLLQQAAVALEHAARVRGLLRSVDTPDEAAALGEFRASLDRFREQLESWRIAGQRDPALEAGLRSSFYALERQTEAMDVRLRQGLVRMTDRLDTLFGITLWVSALLIVGICVAVYVSRLTQLRAVNALRESESRLRALLDHMPEWVWMKDTQSRYVTVNALYASSLHRDVAEITGHTEAEFWPAEQARRFAADDSEVLRTGAPRRLIERLHGSDGGESWVETIKAPVRGGDGTIVGTVGIARDVTDRIRAAEEIRILNTELDRRVQERTAQLEAANRELESFSFSVSHDLRAPLRRIDGWSGALLEEYGPTLDESATHYLHRLRNETHRMGVLIDGLLSLSRVIRTDMALKHVDLSAICNRIVGRLRDAEPDRTVDVDIEPGISLRADPALIEVAMTNILENAWKFTGRRPDPRIVVGRRTEEGRQTIFVRDNGAGFDLQYAEKLFGAFQRMHSQSEFPGTGIGLATVHRIVHRHGGTIWVETEPDKGATFFFTLDAARVPPSPDSVRRSPDPSPGMADGGMSADFPHHSP